VLNTFQKVKLAPSQEETLLSLVENVMQLVPAQTALIFLLEAENGQNEYFAEVAAGPYSDFFLH